MVDTESRPALPILPFGPVRSRSRLEYYTWDSCFDMIFTIQKFKTTTGVLHDFYYSNSWVVPL